MEIKEKNPDKILLNVDFLKSTISENTAQNELQKEYENCKNLFWTFLAGFASSAMSILSSWNNWEIFLISFSVIFTCVFFFCALYNLIKFLHAKKKLSKAPIPNLELIIMDEAKNKIRYTALIVICYQNSKTGELKFMTEKNGNYLIHCDMNPNVQVEQQQNSIINYLVGTYNIQKNQVVDVIPLSEEPFFSIKPIHGEELQNGFIFFQIRLKKKAKANLSNHPSASWKTIHEMEAMPDLMGRNQDIVMALNYNLTKISDSFEDFYGPLHIIWNITNKCPYDCAICATKDDTRQELSTAKKLQVLNHIISAKQQISILDFAGGDPMYNNEIRSLIIQAIHSLGDEHVSVTTTGQGIKSLEKAILDDEKIKLMKKCEITIDASHDNLSNNNIDSFFSRNSSSYSDDNYKQIQYASENLQCLVINIPLLDSDLADYEIENLISKLSYLKKTYPEIQMEAQIIRLMPVGAFYKIYTVDQYRNYQPILVAQKIKTCIDKIGISCRYHCSLRILPGIGNDVRCNMLDKKIGIDCSGNVFACTWGAYLPTPADDITQNPFYLGNLVSTNLKDILSGQKEKTVAHIRLSRDILNHTAKPYCEAISWYFEHTTTENHDPLSSKNP